MAKALILVDVQNDFVEGGSLAVAGGVDLAQRLADSFNSGDFDKYDVIATTQDWHIDPGAHFSDTPDYVDSWPRHCEADTSGAALVESLRLALSGKVNVAVHKGMFAASYSGFDGILEDGGTLAEALRELKVSEIDVVGIASDYCVAQTALDGVKNGFATTVIANYTVGINSEKIEEVLTKTLPQSGVIVK